MGDSEGGGQPVRLFLNGLKPDEPADSICQVLDSRRWLIAEERAAELIACIKPTEMSVERRLAVADYVQRLIMQCFPCQVFTFGSVPLKTYLPDGDIDLTAFSWTPDLKDSWPNDVRNMLESEEKNENAEFQVQDVQFIQAEVRIVKCLVENIVVDISFNQIGGLCTLCFLEEVDILINRNHLFKRSIILIKAWCYYESRILGAHHGLISTYALETLVLYIFHVFNDTFKGPLEVLYRFLEFFSKFDWENFCVSLWGPVPLDSLPEIAAELPRKDGGQLLLSNAYLETCYNFYSDNPHQEQQNTDFPKRSFNVVDPLRLNNNLGRSVSKGNFFRIRSAFAFGAMKLARVLDCPEEELYVEVNQFFVNTWQRHGNRIRPDAPCKLPKCIRPSSPDLSKCRVEGGKESCNVEANDASTDHHANAWKSLQRQLSSGISSQTAQTYSTSEFADVHGEPASRSGLADGRNSHISSPKSDKVNRKGNGPEALRNLNASSSSERPPSVCSASDYAAESEVSSSSYQKNYIDHHTFRHLSKDHVSLPGRVEGTLEEEQERTDMMTNSMFRGFNGQLHLPSNMSLGNVPFAVPPSNLASLSRSRKNVEGMCPGNFTMVDNPWGTNMQFPTVPPSATHYFHGTGLSSAKSEMSESVEEINRTKVDAWDVEEKDWIYHEGSHFNESFNNGSFDHHYQSNLESEAEQTVNLRTLISARDSASRSRTSSGSFWDGAANKISKVMKDRRGMMTAQSAAESAANERVNAVSEYSLTQPDDDKYRKDWKTSSVIDRKDLQSECPSSGQVHQLPGVELPPINGMEGQRAADNPGVTPLRFIPTGPPVPFLTMLRVFNVPDETGTKPSTQITETEKLVTRELDKKLELSSDADLHRWDTLDGDYPTHWQNLLYARSCQNSQKNQGIGYPSQFTHSPAYGIPSGGSLRPLAANMNWCMPTTGGDGRFIPAAPPFTSLANRPPNVYQPFVEEMPRYRGTGTYLPNPINVRDRQVSGNRRANYNYDRSGRQSDRGGNWNHNKPRVAGRNNIQNHYDKSGPRMNRVPADESGAERSWGGSHRRQDSQFTYQSQVYSLHSPTSSRGGSADVAYDTYSLPDCSANGVSPSLASVPPLVMLHPYSQKTGYNPHPQVLEFGSLGPVELSGMNGFSVGEAAMRPTYIPDEMRFQGNLSHKSSPDQTSSPY